MRLRSRRVTLRNGIEFETPALVPGLSSMAMGPLLYPTQDGSQNTPTVCSIVHSDLLLHGWEEALLVSAYDIHYQLLVDASRFSAGFAESRYAQQKFLIIDSGWYEKKANQGGIFLEQQEPPRLWDISLYQQAIDSLDSDVRALVVSWDAPNPESYESQIKQSQEFFGNRQHLASTILLKPPATAGFHNFESLSVDLASNLRSFDVVGVTDKELGDSILDRLVQTRHSPTTS